MKRTLLILAVVVAVGASLVWLALGANCGWTKTSVPVRSVDEITGIEAINYQSRFIPGLEFLGAAWLGSGILAGASFLFRNKPKLKTKA